MSTPRLALHPLVQYPIIFLCGYGAYFVSYWVATLVPKELSGYSGFLNLSLGSLAAALITYGLILAVLAWSLRLLGLAVSRAAIVTAGLAALSLGACAVLLTFRVFDLNPFRLATSGATALAGTMAYGFGFAYVLSWSLAGPHKSAPAQRPAAQ